MYSLVYNVNSKEWLIYHTVEVDGVTDTKQIGKGTTNVNQAMAMIFHLAGAFHEDVVINAETIQWLPDIINISLDNIPN